MARLASPALNFTIVVPRFVSMLLTFISHSSCLDDLWPSTDFFQLFSISVRDARESGDAGDTDSGEDVMESVREGVLGWDLTRDLGIVTLDSRARIMLWEASYCACTVEDNSMTDLNLVERALRHWNN